MNWIPVVVTFFLGLVSALGIEFGKSQLERWQRRNDRRADFQRERLVELLNPARAMFDWIADYYKPRFDEYWNFGVWPHNPDNINLSDDERLKYDRCTTDLRSVASLIGDAPVTMHVDEILKAALGLINSDDGAEGTKYEQAANSAYLALVARIGELLRSL